MSPEKIKDKGIKEKIRKGTKEEKKDIFS